jgi:hypothetical protein
MEYRQLGVASALAIAGHHTGLVQASRDALGDLNPEKLRESHPLGLRLSAGDMSLLLKRMDEDGIRMPPAETLRTSVYGGLRELPVSGMLDVRMLYSTVVDADYIETEAHFEAKSDACKRYRAEGLQLQPARDLSLLLSYLNHLAGTSRASAQVQQMRSDLLDACLAGASGAPGLFTLSAPTGSGKTFSLLAFALKHASEHGLRRLVVVIPYLTIIEQTVQEYRKALEELGSNYLDEYILEHHSLAVERAARNRVGRAYDDSQEVGLLAENWDAPIVVTTSVQLLQSLFANRPSACRKLHRLAGSIVVFDEVQTLPTSIVVPTLAAVSRLSERYRATVVFSTATQPAFTHMDGHVRRYCSAGWCPREVTAGTVSLFGRVQRTSVVWPKDLETRTSWSALVKRLMGSEQALCVVNLKRHAAELHSLLDAIAPEGLFHLSTSMCPAHRQVVLDEVRRRLGCGRPCRLISTQCVEAGVDIDFPRVFRAWGPLSAIAQAAGRCNRNGRSAFGTVEVFIPEDEAYPDPAYQQAATVTRILWQKQGTGSLDIDDPKCFDEYYRELYDLVRPESQAPDLIEALGCRHFGDVADTYQVIPRGSINVLVPYDESTFRLLRDELYETCLTRKWIGRARPHAIGLFRPRIGDPVQAYLAPAPLGSRAQSEEWFIYLAPEHYHCHRGLVLPSRSDSLIG